MAQKADVIHLNARCKEHMRQIREFGDGLHFPGLFDRQTGLQL